MSIQSTRFYLTPCSFQDARSSKRVSGNISAAKEFAHTAGEAVGGLLGAAENLFHQPKEPKIANFVESESGHRVHTEAFKKTRSNADALHKMARQVICAVGADI